MDGYYTEKESHWKTVILLEKGVSCETFSKNPIWGAELLDKIASGWLPCILFQAATVVVVSKGHNQENWEMNQEFKKYLASLETHRIQNGGIHKIYIM